MLWAFQMIRSMTGFGRAEVSGEAIVVTVEARSVNHRHLDVALRLPRALAALEMDARRVVQARVERGRIDVTVQLTPVAGPSTQRLTVDVDLAREYVARARSLADELGMRDDATLTWVMERSGVTRLADGEPAEPAAPWPVLADALARALDELVARRTAEGERLEQELRSLHGELAAHVTVMASRAPAAAARKEERLRERLRSLLADTPIDDGRLLAEAAIWADKTDITEELARLRAHLGEFTLLLDKGGSLGRQLDFLLQELNREVNTVGSKADDLEMSQAALGAKSALEKIREQVQNLE
jgi:uncharacterized protein (TIGR00255 family)